MAKSKKPHPIFTDITITDIAAEGKAIAKVNDIVVFVPFVVPGDVVDLQVTRKKSHFMEARHIQLRYVFPKNYENEWDVLP
jgi:23S rRNA (uracil1939-C5)-methyltransferase